MVQPTSDKPSSSKPEPTAEDLTAIEELLSSGKRHYICQEPQLALDCFVELCKQLSVFYGELGDECAEAYLYYGKCLLDLARLENGVLGHAIKEAPVLGEGEDDSETEVNTDEDDEKLTEEKRVELKAKVQSALREENMYNDASTEEDDDDTVDDSVDDTVDDAGVKKDEQSSAKSEETKKKEPTSTDKTTTNEATTATDEGTKTADEATKTTDEATKTTDEATKTSEPSSTKPDDNMDVDANGDDKESEEAIDEDEEDVTNMQLSWEMFELAVFICSKQVKRGAKDNKIKSTLAEAKYGLAQISMESEHYEVAIKDFTECLDHYTDFLEDKHDRRLAEVNYNIALAYSFDKKFDESIERYKRAAEILKARISDLESKVKEAADKGGKDKASAEQEEWTKEINELKDLVLLDMEAKIEDAIEMKKQAEVSIQAMKDAAKELFSAVGTSGGFDKGFDTGFDAPTDSTAEVIHDCTSKLRSKRKIEDEDTGVDPKKQKQTNGDINGNSKIKENGQMNGHDVIATNGHDAVAAES